ncbi:LytTR family DNA-binding domain-containing protein [Parabacteroides sp. PF5-9]|uniref:LytR/AlgR family response regulator transcription factor n=1 Tax=Parabacteroides sp. PF5-9 TaxID=1742404 RepID=UPI0024768C5F|nr:LytTR family DNA-binding domain-containing protein [Parabacteroides sp. PF5-9]MDH6357524.1 ABC-type multidrug transport system fused ATPase/permease subunit [Parabacteroides sp. PF5-9]
MNRIKAFLQQPIPTIQRRSIVVLVSSIIVILILGFFQPFGLNNLASPFKWLFIAGYGLVTVCGTSIVCFLFPYLFPRFYDPQQWTVGKNLINMFILLLIIGLGNFTYEWSLSNHDPGMFVSVLLAYLFVTLLVGFFPAVIIFYITQTYALKQNLHAAAEMNKRLMDRLNNLQEIKTDTENRLTLTGSTKDSVELSIDQLLYIEASGNYVKICYLENEVVKQKMLRATIAQMEKELEAHPDIIRCHRAFMVNIRQIATVEGNSQGFQLKLYHIKEEVPVSRSYTPVIRKMLE